MAYVDTLVGHQAEITALAAAPSGADRCITVGRDRSLRLWKVPEQSQLVFRAHASDVSDEAVLALTEQWYVSGAADGSLSLWHGLKKKPVHTVYKAHGDGISPPPGLEVAGAEEGAVASLSSSSSAAVANNSNSNSSSSSSSSSAADSDAAADDEEPQFTPGPAREHVSAIAAATGCDPDGLTGGYCNWVTSLAQLPHSDVIVSGSGDGFIRVWRLATASSNPRNVAFRSLEPVGAIPIKGIVNGLSFSGDGTLLVAAVGQEHKSGRWWRYNGGAKNGVAFIRLPQIAAAAATAKGR